MDLLATPFATIDWSCMPQTEYRGESGTSYWRTQQFGGFRLRIIEYTPGFVADHWCTKGHIIFCLSGQLTTELKDGRTFILTPGMSYIVGELVEPHRSSSVLGAKLFVVD